MKVRTAAKINLALDVAEKLSNGYHRIGSVFQTVGLYDIIDVELGGEDIQVSCEQPEEFAKSDPIPCDERNIAYKAARLFLDTAAADTGCRIHIKKGIPSQAGMGGGSTDAAAVLYCLNRLTGERFTAAELAAMGKNIGADVPFFFTGGTAFVGGIGEETEALPDWSGRILVIAKGSEGISTGEAYARVDALKEPVHPDIEGLVDALRNSPYSAHRFFGNIFEQAAELGEVEAIKSVMRENSALTALMTGSGSAVFGLFGDRNAAEMCAGRLRAEGYFSHVCTTVSKSFTEIEKDA
ncbi:MAG: 4-(cytidine 5'-diphospho)-2-C-methyl-D-erythritol kinase [Ruminococcus sp.]|nr:4-(cytidine 5'-diphospho)-2-C-methyl-D-erythritol kinase [Ruminococcus sp.]